MKTGKIKFIDNDGEWNGMTKSKVFFADDSKYTFFHKSPTFKHQVGDEIKFNVNLNDAGEEKGTASLIKDNPGTFKSFGSKNSPDVSKKIERQTVIKALGERFSGAKLDIETELVWADTMYNWIQD